MADEELGWRITDSGDAVLITLSGSLSLRDCVPLRHVVDKQLMDRGRVVVELSGVRLLWSAAVAVFPTALAAAGGWPSARLVIVCSEPVIGRALRAVRVPSRVPVVPDVAAAAAALELRPSAVLRRSELMRMDSIAQHARALVDQACLDWELPDRRDVAACVVTELATNAYQHGAGNVTMLLTVNGGDLRVALRDDGDGSPAVVPDRYGLQVVDQLSSAWGVTADRSGKWVWALLRAPGRSAVEG